MPKIQFENGTVVEFDGEPSAIDVDHVAKQIGLPSSIPDDNAPKEDWDAYYKKNIERKTTTIDNIPEFAAGASEGFVRSGKVLARGLGGKLLGMEKPEELAPAAPLSPRSWGRSVGESVPALLAGAGVGIATGGAGLIPMIAGGAAVGGAQAAGEDQNILQGAALGGVTGAIPVPGMKVGATVAAKTLGKQIGVKTAERVGSAIGGGIASAGVAKAMGASPEEQLKSGVVGGGMAAAMPVSRIKGPSQAFKDTMARGAISELIKPRKVDLAYGKEPDLIIAKKGIIANKFEDLEPQVEAHLEDVGIKIGKVVDISTKRGKRVNADNLNSIIAKDIDSAVQGGAENNALITRLENLNNVVKFGKFTRDPETGSIVPDETTARNLADMTPSEAFELKKRIGAMGKWTGNPSDDKAYNASVQNVYRGLKNQMNESMPELKGLNKDYGDLLSARQAIQNRDYILKRNAKIGLLDSMAGVIGMGHGLSGAALAVGARKALVSTAAKTRFAAWLSKRTPQEIELLRQEEPAVAAVIPQSILEKAMSAVRNLAGQEQLGVTGEAGSRGQVIKPNEVEVLDPRVRKQVGYTRPPQPVQRQIGQGAPEVIAQPGMQEQLPNKQPQLPPAENIYGEGFSASRPRPNSPESSLKEQALLEKVNPELMGEESAIEPDVTPLTRKEFASGKGRTAEGKIEILGDELTRIESVRKWLKSNKLGRIAEVDYPDIKQSLTREFYDSKGEGARLDALASEFFNEFPEYIVHGETPSDTMLGLYHEASNGRLSSQHMDSIRRERKALRKFISEGKKGQSSGLMRNNRGSIRLGSEGKVGGEGKKIKALEKSSVSPLGFYSKSEQIINEKVPNSVDATQLKNTLINNGVKPEEISQLGIDTLEGKVSKSDLLTMIKANQVPLEEKVLGTISTPENLRSSLSQFTKTFGPDKGSRYWVTNIGRADFGIDEIGGKFRATVTPSTREGFKDVGTFDTFDDALSALSKETAKVPSSQTKFSQYQLPGGENYREVLIKLPKDKVSSKETFEQFTQRVYRASPDNLSERQRYVAQQHYNRLDNKSDLNDFSHNNFQSSHFDDPNILVHARINDRMVDGKKVLFIEEIQSDWHQEGRRKGYSDKQVEFRGQNVYVPDAPFKKTWHELMFKRLLDKAVNEGYDSVAWTTGEQQASRYDLSKQVEGIDAWRMDESRRLYDVNVRLKDGKIQKFSDQSESGLEDLIGKELSKKVIEHQDGPSAEEGVHLSGLDLKVGGEGMKGFYDQILPSFANKYTKKWGGKVGKSEIKAEADSTFVHSLDITPSMKSEISSKGQPLFSIAGILAATAGSSLLANEAEASEKVPTDPEEMTKHFEGFRDKRYNDTRKIPTIGYGFNLNEKSVDRLLRSNGWTGGKLDKTIADKVFKVLYRRAKNDAKMWLGLSNYNKLTPEAQSIVSDMSYNLGRKLRGFDDMKKALLAKNYVRASKEMVNSNWYKQVKNRSKYLVERMAKQK